MSIIQTGASLSVVPLLACMVGSDYTKTACSSFWSILELFEQKKRVERGWFPKNPNKKK
ncbi:MAG: DUF4491 family protein [Paludibacteraceae bacterium]|nr:DUF4491 family protein [Paludibacteraceae bacterium]